MTQQHVVIIGSGLAGYMLAKEIRKHSGELKITIVTRDQGRFYSKPQLSISLSQGKSAEDIMVSSADTMRTQLDMEVRAETTVTMIDKKQKRVFFGADDYITYDKLVLAVGAEPIIPSFGGDASDALLVINNLQDYATLRQHLKPKDAIAVIGAGLVGCEFANDFTKAGHPVHVIDCADYPLSRLLPDVCARAVQHALQDQGVTWCLGDGVSAISHRASDQGYNVHTSQLGEIAVQHVVSAIGLRPHLALARAMGLETKHGICTDLFLTTSDPDVYALGDCAEVAGQVRLYVAPLLQCARTLAKTLCGEPTAVKIPHTPIVIKTSACPVALLPPVTSAAGQWEISGEAPNLCAKHITAAGQFTGFALTGDQVKQRMLLAKQIED